MQKLIIILFNLAASVPQQRAEEQKWVPMSGNNPQAHLNSHNGPQTINLADINSLQAFNQAITTRIANGALHHVWIERLAGDKQTCNTLMRTIADRITHG